MKNLLYLFLLFAFQKSSAQVIITEVYYDTPYLEDLYHYTDLNLPNPNPFLHHLGEFIEIYNYTTEDIPLDGWRLVDKVSSFTFPQGTVIKSNDFLVVAYRPANMTTNYFTTFFPNTIGKEDHIIYQENILLRNLRENVRLKMGMLRGVHFNDQTVSAMTWNYDGTNITNPIDNAYDPQSVNSSFNYYVPSMQLGDHETVTANANPLSANYVPPTQPIEEMTGVMEMMADNIAEMTWDYYSDQILNNTCPEDITIAEQIPDDTYLPDGKCFTYDDSGIITGMVDCQPQPQQPQTSTDYSSEQIDEISSKISLAPNPTTGVVTVTWDMSISGKISQIQITSISGTAITVIPVSATQLSASFDLSGQPTGIYIVRFILDTGQPISKNVMKV